MLTKNGGIQRIPAYTSEYISQYTPGPCHFMIKLPTQSQNGYPSQSLGG